MPILVLGVYKKADFASHKEQVSIHSALFHSLCFSSDSRFLPGVIALTSIMTDNDWNK